MGAGAAGADPLSASRPPSRSHRPPKRGIRAGGSDQQITKPARLSHFQQIQKCHFFRIPLMGSPLWGHEQSSARSVRAGATCERERAVVSCSHSCSCLAMDLRDCLRLSSSLSIVSRSESVMLSTSTNRTSYLLTYLPTHQRASLPACLPACVPRCLPPCLPTSHLEV